MSLSHISNYFSDAKQRAECSNLSVSSSLSHSNFLAHAEDSDLMHIEGMTLGKAMMAGSIAGVTEHACMFPVDTIKTRMQTASIPGVPVYRNVWKSIKNVVRTEGFGRLYRGLPAVALSAVPSHALYFGTFETMKRNLGASRESHTPLANVLSGMCATVAHDAISTPMDVVKQRMQVFGSQHTSIVECIRHLYRSEGQIAFYQSYPTTVMLNIPYICAHFAVYEGMHTLLHDSAIDDTPLADILSGAAAGAAGALISNPLDVVKTRIQTQIIPEGGKRQGAREIVRDILKNEGFAGFGKGAAARITMFIPSAAICWTVYEGLKRFMLPNYKGYSSNVGHTKTPKPEYSKEVQDLVNHQESQECPYKQKCRHRAAPPSIGNM